MSEDEPGEDEEQSFRERVEEIRQQQAEQDDELNEPGMGDPFGGGGPGGMGGNPFAQMMGGMMGGGPGGGGAGGDLDTERVVRELGQLREELQTTNETLERIAVAIEDD